MGANTWDLEHLERVCAAPSLCLIAIIMDPLTVIPTQQRALRAVHPSHLHVAPRAATLMLRLHTTTLPATSTPTLARLLVPRVRPTSNQPSWQVAPWRPPSQSILTLRTMAEASTTMCQEGW